MVHFNAGARRSNMHADHKAVNLAIIFNHHAKLIAWPCIRKVPKESFGVRILHSSTQPRQVLDCMSGKPSINLTQASLTQAGTPALYNPSRAPPRTSFRLLSHQDALGIPAGNQAAPDNQPFPLPAGGVRETTMPLLVLTVRSMLQARTALVRQAFIRRHPL